ncbi:benzoate/H(+) symporter BenE family transporter [Castellaniella sp.]|uniref:benzoate/H(+) symporter BenE family transporter n=1 Tax=Castellaniella sp. TaxID=1955812 RepID=UPI002AFE75FA|nr:benzoate/H(+) symporter BenE family transporter [Castellaniella sp.]
MTTPSDPASSSGQPVSRGLAGWLRISHVASGFIAVLVGYTSSVAIVFQAASAAGAQDAQLASWMWALGIGMGITCIGLSLAWRAPVLTAWSTPGAALLATSLGDIGLAQAIGVFIASSLLITLCGLTGWFQKIMDWVPRHLASAMLAGILLRFGMDLFTSMQGQPTLVIAMFATFVAARRLLPRYSVPLALLAGMVCAILQGTLSLGGLDWTPAHPVWMAPAFSVSALVGVALPLFIVTMTSQNVPGLAVLRANGYARVPASPLISWTGLTGIVLAPFGGFAYNLAAITAAICMSPDADPDTRERYKASVWAGAFYLLTGIFGATVVALFAAFPHELVAAIAGLALLGTLGNSIHESLQTPEYRESALVTFLATASGMSLLGIGSAFWGLVLGIICHAIQQRRA